MVVEEESKLKQGLKAHLLPDEKKKVLKMDEASPLDSRMKDKNLKMGTIWDL